MSTFCVETWDGVVLGYVFANSRALPTLVLLQLLQNDPQALDSFRLECPYGPLLGGIYRITEVR